MSLTLRIPRALKSPNAARGGHWRVRHDERKAWEREIWAAALGQGVRGRDARPDGVHRVTVTRIVPSGRNFIRDEDNLRFSAKPINDALKRLWLIRDDSRKWLEQPQVQQEVSPIGEWATVITIEPVGASSAAERAS